MASKSGHAQIADASLYYEITGEGEPVVLVHGFALDSRMWDGQVRAWSPHYQVIRYDLRGFGKSSPGQDPYTHADDLMGLLRHLEVPRATIVGLSLGGGAAINFALLYPEAARALVTVDPTLGGFQFSSEFMAAQAALPRVASEEGLTPARASWLRSPLFSHALRIPAAANAIRTMVGEYSGRAWTNPDKGRRLKPPAIVRLAEINVPTLVVVGELDTADFRGIADTLAHGIRGARLAVVKGAGHIPNLEAPEFFNDVVLDFLKDVHAGRAHRGT